MAQMTPVRGRRVLDDTAKRHVHLMAAVQAGDDAAFEELYDIFESPFTRSL